MGEAIDRDGFRANVGIVLSNADGHLLLAGRAGQRGWQFPQGGIEPEEDPMDAMYRELREEIGLAPTDVQILSATEPWLRYRLPQRYMRRHSQPACVGQKQIWYLLRLLSCDDAVQLDRCEAPEFDRWRWVDYWQPVHEVIYFKKRVYLRALKHFAPVLFPDGLLSPPPRIRRHRRASGSAAEG